MKKNLDNPVPSLDNNLLKIYEEFRDSDILEGCDQTILLAFLYYVKKRNLEGKSFNPHYYNNIEKDVINSRILDLEKMYGITIYKNSKETLYNQNKIEQKTLQNGVETEKN